VKDRNNRRRDFSYDINDNLTKEAWGNGIQLQFIYDKVGNLKQSIDGASNTSNIYNYDEIYQLTDASTGNVNFHYDYDVYGDLTKRQERVNGLPTVTVEYQYDKNHQLKKLSQSGLGVTAQVMDLGYDRLNQLTNISRTTANATGALVTDYQYNQVGLLKDINNYFVKPTVFNPVTTISNYHYDYDAGNRLTLKSGTDGNSVIDYGKDNQLKLVDNSSRADEAYNFNALGIRNNWSTVTGDSRQVQNDGKFEYRYDDEGNLTRKTELASGNITNYEWDYRNRLSKVSSAGQIVDYQYDAEDRRVGKAIDGVTKEKYLYDGQDIALVVGTAGTITERYLYGSGVDNVLSREANGQVTWSLGDRQGSIVDLVNEQGAILNHFVYDSFGNRTGTTSADFRFGYTGRELDTETGLYYYRARYYDAAVGRFINEDPIGFSAGDTNLYRYVFNNATNYTDPSGEFANVAAGVGLGALYGGLYAFANDIETGNFGLDTFGNVARGAALGAVAGAVISSGLGLVAAGLSSTGVAASSIQAGSLVLGAAATGWGIGSGILNISNGKPLTGTLDLVSAGFGVRALSSGYQGYKTILLNETLDNLAAQTKATISSIEEWQVSSGNVPGLNSKSPYKIGFIDTEGVSLPYSKANNSILDIYNPLANQGQTSLDRLIASGRLTGESINLIGAIKLNDIRQNAAQALNLSLKNTKNIVNAKTRNTAFADVWINNKQGGTPDFMLKGISGTENIKGYARYTTLENRVLKTQLVNGKNRAQDPEAKILEEILMNTNKYDKIHIALSTERPICGSCADVTANFLAQRPNATVNISGSVIR
jgi:RHS repeat-associated protein